MKKVALCYHPDITFSIGVLKGVAAYLQQQHPWRLCIRSMADNDLEKALHGWDGDGVIASITTKKNAAYAHTLSIPLVNITGLLSHSDIPSVIGDDEAIGRLAADYFYDRGFRQFTCLGHTANHFARTRELSYNQQIHDRHAELLPGLDGSRLFQKNWNDQQHDLAAWLVQLPHPIAIFAIFDPLAQLVVEAAHLAELRIPDDIAILGVDNDPIFCETSSPKISSVLTALDRRGYQAAQLLDQLMAGSPPPTEPIHIPPEGVISRRSTDIFATHDERIREALHFIATRTGDGLNVADVAKATSMSRRNLERRFQLALNRTVYDEIRRQRLETAKHHLADLDLSMLDVALMSGFRSSSDLANAFQRHLETTPTDYRKRFAMR